MRAAVRMPTGSAAPARPASGASMDFSLRLQDEPSARRTALAAGATSGVGGRAARAGRARRRRRGAPPRRPRRDPRARRSPAGPEAQLGRRASAELSGGRIAGHDRVRHRRGEHTPGAMPTRAERVLARIRATPEGFVRTYGDVSPGAPRFAGTVLASCDDPTCRGTGSSAPTARSPRAPASARCSRPRASRSAASASTCARAAARLPSRRVGPARDHARAAPPRLPSRHARGARARCRSCASSGRARCTCCILHTSASLTLNENASPDVRRDFESWFDDAVPEDAPYWTHTLEGPDDMPAHIKAVAARPVADAAGPRRPARARHLAGHLPLRAPRPRRGAHAASRRSTASRSPDHLPRGPAGDEHRQAVGVRLDRDAQQRRAGLGQRLGAARPRTSGSSTERAATPNAARDERPVGRAAERSTACAGRPRTGPAAGGPCRASALSSSTILTGSSSSTAVASSCRFISSEPSPETHTTVASGAAAWAPSAAGRPKPIVPRPPEVSQRRGALEAQAVGRPHLVLADVGRDDRLAAVAACSASSAASGSIAPSPCAAARGGWAARQPSIRAHQSARRADRRELVPARRGCAESARRASPTIGTCAATFLPISAASMSTWTIVARGRTRRARRSRGRRSARRRRRSGRPRPSPSWPPGAVHAEHPEPALVGRRERTERHQRRRDRELEAPRERREFRGRLGVHDAAAGVEHRPPRLGDRRRSAAQLAPVRRRRACGSRAATAPRRHRRARGPSRRRRYVDQHRPGPARGCDMERLVDRARGVVGALDGDRVLDDRVRHPDHVALLERHRADEVARHLRGDEHRRDRVHVGVGDRGDEVRRARDRSSRAPRRRGRTPSRSPRRRGPRRPRGGPAHGGWASRAGRRGSPATRRRAGRRRCRPPRLEGRDQPVGAAHGGLP